MSYSRWSNSRWYTFWSANGAEPTEYKWPTQKLKDGQVFEICDIPSYFITYGQLRDTSRSKVLHEIEELFAKDGIRPTWDELNELQLYFARFIKDVDDHFRFWTFMKYEWYVPFRNKIIIKYRTLKQRYVKDRSK
jgi:hypothetical protein